MKLQELRMDTQSAPKEVLSTNGTYVAVVPNESTLALLADWSAKAKITLDPTLHCTLLFSRAPLEITVLQMNTYVLLMGLQILEMLLCFF